MDLPRTDLRPNFITKWNSILFWLLLNHRRAGIFLLNSLQSILFGMCLIWTCKKATRIKSKFGLTYSNLFKEECINVHDSCEGIKPSDDLYKSRWESNNSKGHQRWKMFLNRKSNWFVDLENHDTTCGSSNIWSPQTRTTSPTSFPPINIASCVGYMILTDWRPCCQELNQSPCRSQTFDLPAHTHTSNSIYLWKTINALNKFSIIQ